MLSGQEFLFIIYMPGPASRHAPTRNKWQTGVAARKGGFLPPAPVLFLKNTSTQSIILSHNINKNESEKQDDISLN